MTKLRKKLIEVALPLEAINKASAREKSIRHGHPSTLHLWWARRPLAAEAGASPIAEQRPPAAPVEAVELGEAGGSGRFGAARGGLPDPSLVGVAQKLGPAPLSQTTRSVGSSDNSRNTATR